MKVDLHWFMVRRLARSKRSLEDIGRAVRGFWETYDDDDDDEQTSNEEMERGLPQQQRLHSTSATSSAPRLHRRSSSLATLSSLSSVVSIPTAAIPTVGLRQPWPYALDPPIASRPPIFTLLPRPSDHRSGWPKTNYHYRACRPRESRADSPSPGPASGEERVVRGRWSW